ncbi:MAG TPA: hypothetical protein VG457_06220 [Planctomycetota bacterium]|nr:hypothetical protein [Planctomycetota bacterium]
MNLLSLLLLPCALAQADPPLAVEIGHAQWECEANTKGWSCGDAGHFRIWLDGKELKDVDTLTMKLKEISGGRVAIDRKILLRPSLKTPFERVWPVLGACRSLNCTNLVWWEEAPQGPAPKKPEGGANGPLDAVIRIDRERLRGTEIRVQDGPWIKKEADALNALEKLGATPETRLLLDPGADTPWSDISRLEEACRGKGFTRVEYLGMLPLPGPPRAVGPEDISRLVQLLDGATAEEQPALFDRLLDRHELNRRLIGSTVVSGRIRHLVTEMFEMVAPSGKTLAKGTPGEKPLRFIRTKDFHPVFRFLPPGGLDYIELFLEKDDRGETRIVDVRNMTLNATSTEHYRSFIFSDDDKIKFLNELRAPTPGDLAYFSNPALGKLVGLATQGKFPESIEVFRTGAETLRKSEFAFKVYLNVSRQVSAEAFVAAVDEYEKSFPSSTALPFVKMESLLAKGDRGKALEAIDAVDRWIGGDPYLELLRARACSELGDFAAAAAFAEKATQREPGLAIGWGTLVDLRLRQKDYKGLAAALTAIEQKLQRPVDDLIKDPGFTDFVQSEEYRRWIASRKK